MRKEPPISTSSPRLTSTSRPSESVFTASSTAAALSLTTTAASAPTSRRARVAAPAREKVELQVRVAGGDLRHAGGGAAGQRRAAQVGVDHHPGGVDDAHQRGGGRGQEALLQRGRQRAQALLPVGISALAARF